MNSKEIDAAMETGTPVVLSGQTDGLTMCLVLERAGQHVNLLSLGQVRSVSPRLMKIADIYHQRPEQIALQMPPPGRLLKASMYAISPSGGDWGRNAVQALTDLRATYLPIKGHVYEQACRCYAAAAEVFKKKGATLGGVLMWLPATMVEPGTIRISGSLPETWLKKYGCRTPPRMALYSISTAHAKHLAKDQEYLDLFRRRYPARSQ